MKKEHLHDVNVEYGASGRSTGPLAAIDQSNCIKHHRSVSFCIKKDYFDGRTILGTMTIYYHYLLSSHTNRPRWHLTDVGFENPTTFETPAADLLGQGSLCSVPRLKHGRHWSWLQHISAVLWTLRLGPTISGVASWSGAQAWRRTPVFSTP